MGLSSTALIGASLPRSATRRLLQGSGQYVDDFNLPGMLHVVFVRSPHAKAAFSDIDVRAARLSPGVAAVFTGKDLLDVCDGWRGDGLTYLGFKPPLQRVLSIDHVAYQGEAVAAVVAESRALAEDAAELVNVAWVVGEATTDLATSARAQAAHPELQSNLGFQATIGAVASDADKSVARVVEDTFEFARQTGVPLETRGIIADFEPAERLLTVRHSHQVPNETQSLFARLLHLEEHHVRVVCPDVGGGFGIKLHMYADELATAAIATRLHRPVKFIADRSEALLTDIHAREHRIKARMSVDAEGRIRSIEIQDLFGMGAYSTAPRTSLSEAMLALRFMGAAYQFEHYHATLEAVFQNRAPTGQYRAVGMPIGCMVTERLLDHAACELGLDPAEIRRRNFLQVETGRGLSGAGMPMFNQSHHACLERILALSDWPALTKERDRLREQGIYRGVGLAVFVEPSAPGSEINGRAGLPILAMDSATIKIEPSGTVRCLTSVTDQGQGTSAGIAQIVAGALGVALEDVVVSWGDTAASPPGGGAWASRGVAIGGEAAWGAARRLRDEVLNLAASLSGAERSALDIRDGRVVESGVGRVLYSLRELAEIAYFRSYLLPDGVNPQFAISHQYRRGRDPFIPANGIQLSHVEVDVETGKIKLLKHWVVEDCGRAINPLLVDEQIRGGVVQGLGPALFEAYRYDSRGSSLIRTMTDYLVPTFADMPDIVVDHLETPYSGTELGAKGVGEGGTCGAAAAVLNAVNDALSPLSAVVTSLPMTPAVVLRSLGKC